MFEPNERARIRRGAYAAYDPAVIFAILDAGLLCHVGYVRDGAPFVTPTAYWREEDRLFWHGAAASRLFRDAAAAQPVCVTVSHLDGLVLARSSFRHTMLYRSVMAFGHATLLSDPIAKRRSLDGFIDRLYPGRSRDLRPISQAELDATQVMSMVIEDASAKTATVDARGGIGVIDKEEDYAAAVWAGVIPLGLTVGAARADGRLLVDPALPASLAAYRAGATLDSVLQHLSVGP